MMAVFRKSGRKPELLPGRQRFGLAPWLIAIMVFLSALALAGYLAVAGMARGLESDLSRRITVQLATPNPDQRAMQAKAIVDAAARDRDIVAVDRLTRPELVALIEPWFGRGNVTADLPLPELIDVTLVDGAAKRIEAVSSRIRALAPNARIDSQATWLGPLARMLDALQLMLLAVLALLMVSLIAVVVLATRAQLNTHRETIEVIHMIGAEDGQISSLFQRQAFTAGLLGGVAGLVVALALLAAVGGLVSAVGSGLLGVSMAAAGQIWLLCLLPLIAAILAQLAARQTVLRALRTTL